jgi:DNA-binding NtrC family response regulator
MTETRALIVDDDASFVKGLVELVSARGFAVDTAHTLAHARTLLAKQVPDLVLVDLNLPDGVGLDLLEDLEGHPGCEIVLITGDASVESAVGALRQGAADYLTKPLDLERLEAILANVARRRELREEVESLRGELRNLGRFGPLIGASAAMQEVYDKVSRVAPTNASVFIQGESGTGKELVAHAIHRFSRRRKRPMLTLNCGAVSPQLIESELFGHERGSFTGADRMHKGYFERAHGGTLFLDEITEMPAGLQVKLLRVLEAGRVTRVGSERELEIDVRVVAATNRNPLQAVTEEVLRQDLFFRLSVFPVLLPPLRDRDDDVELLTAAFLKELNEEEGARKGISRAALQRLRRHDWPGNVRELRNAVQRAFILAGDDIDETHFGDLFQPKVARSQDVTVAVGSSIADAERQLILATLERLDGNKERAASVLGISVKTLYNRLNQYKE